MPHPVRRLRTIVGPRLRSLWATRKDDRGASVVETVIIAAALAALALSAMAAIALLVDQKVAGISL